MTPKRAKQLAEQYRFHFYWDSSLGMYAMYPKDFEQEASYWTKATLAGLAEQWFIDSMAAPSADIESSLKAAGLI